MSTTPQTKTTEATAADPRTWAIDPQHSEVGFEVKHMMFAKVRGRFGTFEGTVETGPDGELDRARVHTVIETASIDTGQDDRDEHLRSADFFDAEQFPEIRFESASVRRVDDDRLVVEGELTIRDVTHEVELDVEELGSGTDPWGNERVGYRATTRIDRRDFGLTWNQALETGGVLVGNDIEITLEIQAVEDTEEDEAS